MAWSWRLISLSLCVFGFLREIRPSEPFVTDFMVQPWRNVTTNDVNRYVFPIGTYSYAAQLVFVFLLTDYLRYKPLIIASGLSGIVVWSLLIWTRSLTALQILEVFYGTYMATEVAYYTYIYAKVDRLHYLKVTSHTRAAILCGRFVHGVLGQALVYTRAMDYLELNYITLAGEHYLNKHRNIMFMTKIILLIAVTHLLYLAQIASTLWAFTLPAVTTSVYFHRKSIDLQSNGMTMIEDTHLDDVKPSESLQNTSTRHAFFLLWHQFRRAYSNSNVVIWSFWYAVGMCGFLQTVSYIQVLWAEIDSSQAIVWNGAVEALNTLLGAGVAILAGYLHTDRMSRSSVLWSLVACSLCEGGAILLASQTISRNVSYVGYLIFYVLYSFTITVASAEVAKHLEDDSYGLIFGINTLAALILQTVLTIVIVSDSGFALSVINQYAVLSGYFFALAAVYLITIIGSAICSRRRCKTVFVVEN